MKKISFLEGESLDMYDNYNYDPGYNATGVLPDDVKAQPHIGNNIGHSNLDINFSDDEKVIKRNNDKKDIVRLKKLIKILQNCE